MKTVVSTRCGPPNVLQTKDVKRPAPKDNKELIKVYATTVTSGMFGFGVRHTLPGSDFPCKSCMVCENPENDT